MHAALVWEKDELGRPHGYHNHSDPASQLNSTVIYTTQQETGCLRVFIALKGHHDQGNASKENI